MPYARLNCQTLLRPVINWFICIDIVLTVKFYVNCLVFVAINELLSTLPFIHLVAVKLARIR